ncbi:MAG: radical SAM protein, partial [Bacteroidales bacterium]|nr:radical SAM protein [Bacteroidales bacterium]
ISTTVKKDEFQELYSNGFIWLQPGIENLSNNFLQHMNKGTHVLQNLQVMKWARELGIHIVWSIMYHFPKENNDWYNDLLEIMPKLTHLSPPGSLNKLRYDRFSEYHTHSEKYNLELQPREYYKYIYPFEENILTDFVYFFEEKKRI